MMTISVDLSLPTQLLFRRGTHSTYQNAAHLAASQTDCADVESLDLRQSALVVAVAVAAVVVEVVAVAGSAVVAQDVCAP